MPALTKTCLPLLAAALACAAPPARAAETFGPPAPAAAVPAPAAPLEDGADGRPGPNLMGALGLNTVPSARMDENGTFRISVGGAAPFVNTVAGAQLTDGFNLAVRQTAQTSGLHAKADRLYPGIDLRLRLLEENGRRPEIALGLQSAVGHKKTAGEYLAFSKRYNAFDFTAGIGWGKFGGAGHIPNPFGALSRHFKKDRDIDSELPNGPHDWFTGDTIGLFGGVEYFTPFRGVSLRLDWNADDYAAEREIAGFDPPGRWAASVNYAPRPWANFGLGLVGGDTVMLRAALQSPIQAWPLRSYGKEKPPPFPLYRTGLAAPAAMETAAEGQALTLYDTRAGGKTASARLEGDGTTPFPLAAGRAARAMAAHAGQEIEELQVTPTRLGLTGRSLHIMRRDLERALHGNGSAAEIWRNAAFAAAKPEGIDEGGWWRRMFSERGAFGLRNLSLRWDTQASLNEEDSGVLYRTSLIAEKQEKLSPHFMAGAGLRLDAADNLRKLLRLRPYTLEPVRSDAALFAENRLSTERAYLGWLGTLRPDLHVGLAAGYLEEMYAGAGGEILYRPFGKTFAIGGDLWEVSKRDPATALELGLRGEESAITGHVNFWYEIPGTDYTASLKLGRYLGGDTGGTLGLARNFRGGAQLSAFLTATTMADRDPFGGTTHLYGGLALSLPLGHAGPAAASARLTLAQLGRDSGQALDAPFSLYEMTEPFSYRGIAANWQEITQ
jgi:hypothetical protein